MKFILLVIITLAACSTVPSQAAQDEPHRYTYHVWGNVLDEQARAMPRTTVCLVPAQRPINGRIPCTKTDEAGNFALTVEDIPDKYKVCASTTDSPFIFEGDKDKGHRAVCSEVVEFGAKDECKKVSLKFEAP
ncbi:MAG: hypothetical protein LC785_04975 [Acidobacteria bacterium]|nr:hypothetical protein [Acidobacteriota bacterium]